ncbi:hypothetical protein GNI_130520 [Gregarina niphandrodes]|uniref:Uncharacterized protein n=1 Tax=Gregarina niphandrodes TaxID=110365 RepID=A0A023B221_GRENI|nr:hypothetical protein GNI_130520 [Gregarina niphandrodes]EZG47693.1 hypothetical protein GNI_130520 [Gregarina niphandrodes]|eukprot:XP_011132146.1 hypothetical protein GNI_130520 [Gregarina niphandrodes]
MPDEKHIWSRDMGCLEDYVFKTTNADGSMPIPWPGPTPWEFRRRMGMHFAYLRALYAPYVELESIHRDRIVWDIGAPIRENGNGPFLQDNCLDGEDPKTALAGHITWSIFFDTNPQRQGRFFHFDIDLLQVETMLAVEVQNRPQCARSRHDSLGLREVVRGHRYRYHERCPHVRPNLRGRRLHLLRPAFNYHLYDYHYTHYHYHHYHVHDYTHYHHYHVHDYTHYHHYHVRDYTHYRYNHLYDSPHYRYHQHYNQQCTYYHHHYLYDSPHYRDHQHYYNQQCTYYHHYYLCDFPHHHYHYHHHLTDDHYQLHDNTDYRNHYHYDSSQYHYHQHYDYHHRQLHDYTEHRYYLDYTGYHYHQHHDNTDFHHDCHFNHYYFDNIDLLECRHVDLHECLDIDLH